MIIGELYLSNNDLTVIYLADDTEMLDAMYSLEGISFIKMRETLLSLALLAALLMVV